MKNTQYRRQFDGRYRGRHIGQRQMCGRERHPQRALRRFASQHHHHARRFCLLGEVFGVAGKGTARIIDHTLVQRGGDHGRELPRLAPGNRPIQETDHIIGVGCIQLTGDHGGRKRQITDGQHTAP